MTGEEAGQQSLEEQAKEILDEETEATELVSHLEFGLHQYSDQYADWHSSTPLEPVVRALLLKELEDYSFSELHQFLTDSGEAAELLGFENIPSRTTFGRAWRDRLDNELKSYLTEQSMAIAGIAWQRGNSLGLQALDTEDKSEASERTKDRYVSQKAKDVTEELQRLVYPCFDFERKNVIQYETDQFLDLQSHLGLSHSAAESGTDLYADDVGYDEAPDADTHLYNIKRLDPEKVLDMVDLGISVMANEAKNQVSINRKVAVAIDMTYVAYYGERDELEMVMGAPRGKSYDWCYKFATLTVVGDQVKFTLAMRPVQKGDYVWAVVQDLVQQAKEHMPISTVYADAEFCSAGTIRVLDEENVGYIIPSPKNKRVKREVKRMNHDVRVMDDYGIYGPVPSGQTQRRGGTNLVLLPSTADPEKTVAFITSKDVSDETVHDRDFVEMLIQQYNRRWGIENSYKTIKDFLAWTTSKDYTVRLFYFGFAVLLYNMWLLVDLLVQIALDVERRNKPRVTAKRFLNLARKRITGVG